MVVGDIVQFRQEFLSPRTGIGYQFADIADVCGELVEIKTLRNGRAIARVKWDDDTESSAGIDTLTVVRPVPEFPETHYQENLLMWRKAALVSIAEKVKEEWRKL